MRVFNPGVAGRPQIVRAQCEPGGKEVPAVRLPDPWCPRDAAGHIFPKYIPHEDGTAYVNLGNDGRGGGGFFHLRKGAFFDVPSGIAPQAILDAGPHHVVGDGHEAREVPTLLLEGSPAYESYLEQEAARKESQPASDPVTSKTAPASPKAKA